jgi:hypothetical protein
MLSSHVPNYQEWSVIIFPYEHGIHRAAALLELHGSHHDASRSKSIVTNNTSLQQEASPIRGEDGVEHYGPYCLCPRVTPTDQPIQQIKASVNI